MKEEERLIVALDVDNEKQALKLVDELKAVVKTFKVGSELFTLTGPDILKRINDKGSKIFLDLKFHDIPNTVARASRAATRLGVSIFNVHALGGYEMMKRTCEAVKSEAERLKIARPKILAVTILTSIDGKDLKKMGVDDNIERQVLRLASLARDAGLDGVVASPLETKSIRKKLGDDFLIATPGVRPKAEGANDQRRIATPKEAVENGADYIVVGRPITEAKDPLSAVRKILEEIA